MAGLNNIREAYEQVYAQLDERMDDDAREMRRLAAAERRAGKSDRMDAKVAAKYADSEAKSAATADKKSKGKHIHGMADSYEIDGDLVDEAKVDEKTPEWKRSAVRSQRRTDLMKTHGATKDSPLMKFVDRDRRAEHKAKRGVKKEEVELTERQLDPTETKEKERLVKGLKKSASDFKARYGERAKSVMYATATKMAKDRMDTSKSDRRYGVER